MPTTWDLKPKTTEPRTDSTVFADQVETLSSVEQMKMIERMAETMPLHAFRPVRLSNVGEVEAFDIEDGRSVLAIAAD